MAGRGSHILVASGPRSVMQNTTMRIEITVPSRQVLDMEVAHVQLPLTTGYLGVLPGHAPMLAEVGTGELAYSGLDGSEHYLAVDGGTVEILPDRVRLLATNAERDTEIDVERANRALARANDRLRLTSVEIDTDRAQKALARAKARIAVASTT